MPCNEIILSLYLKGEKLWICGSFKSAKKLGSANLKKIYGPANRKSEAATFAEVLPKKIKSANFADL